MKDILTAPFVKELMETTANMYRLGWDERNGGNISYLLDEAEVEEYLDLTRVIPLSPLRNCRNCSIIFPAAKRW